MKPWIVLAMMTAVFAGRVDAQTAAPARVMAEAATTLQARISEAKGGTGKLPLLTDLADAALIRGAFDRDVIRSMQPELVEVITLCAAITQAQLGYAELMAPGTGDNTVRRIAKIKRVEDEAVLATAAADLCTKKMMRSGDLFVAKLPSEQASDKVRVEGVKTMRAGATQVALGTIQAVGDPVLSSANRSLLLDAMQEDADQIAANISLVQRGAVRAAIDSAPTTIKARLAPLRRAYERTDCTGLCKMGA